ncbi:MAG: hypothetical protein ACI3XZ_00405 [Butyricicoccus sp.]
MKYQLPLLSEGKTPEETAAITQHPPEFVHAAAELKIGLERRNYVYF